MSLTALCEHGIGIPFDHDLAVLLGQLGAVQDHLPSQGFIAYGLTRYFEEESPRIPRRWRRLSALRGFSLSQKNLAYHYKSQFGDDSDLYQKWMHGAVPPNLHRSLPVPYWPT